MLCIVCLHFTLSLPTTLPPSCRQLVAFCRLWADVVLGSGFSHVGRATPKLHVGKCPFFKGCKCNQNCPFPKDAHVPKPALCQMLSTSTFSIAFVVWHAMIFSKFLPAAPRLLDPLPPASQRSFLVGQLFQLLCFIFGTLHQLGTFFQEGLQIRACGFLFASQSHLELGQNFGMLA